MIEYATPSLSRSLDGSWVVRAHPSRFFVGRVSEFPAGWVATTSTGRPAGLWPAAEVLVKQAGYELGEL